MAGRLIEGSMLANRLRDEVKQEVENLKIKGITPTMAIVVVDGPNANARVADLKFKVCQQLGVSCKVLFLPAYTSQEELLSLIEDLNASPEIHGINLHPLPVYYDYYLIYSALQPDKDLEGLHPANLGDIVIGKKKMVPFMPLAVMELIKSTGIVISGKQAVAISRSDYIGKPLAFMLLEEHATVSICSSRTRKISHYTRLADILIVATGHAERIPGHIIKPGAVVIDVGANMVGGHIVGDVEFKTAKEVVSWITPVPGGVGPVSIAMMLKNLLKAARTMSS